MKVVIDISDKMFDTFKKHGIMTFDNLDEYDRDMIADAIANGTPYEDKWIPVKERLPDKDGVYLVTLEYVEDSEIVNEIDIAKFVSSEKDDCNDGFHKAYPVIAWRPLPEVYMEGL